jgi:hypothetical protein
VKRARGRRSNRSESGRTFFGSDRYARIALGDREEIGDSFADLDIFVAARGVSESVIPEIDEALLSISGPDADVVSIVEATLLGRTYGRDLWNEPSMPMELRDYVTQLIHRGRLFVRLHFAKSDQGVFDLIKTTWLAPETILHRPRAGVYEQYASARALMEPGIVVGEPQEYLGAIPESEVFAIHWPLPEPGDGSPALAALALGREVARQADRTLLVSQARAEPQETYISVARARSGAFGDALEMQKLLSAQIKDTLFYPGAYEAEAFPWVEEATDYFRAERILRSRIAICQLRTYLFDELNSQILGRWASMNSWGPVRIGLRPQLFDETDWIDLRSGLAAGEVSLEDVRAAVATEAEDAFAIGRQARE